ncbi:MAG TPA: VWA domain-containing protein [Candidatus Polarisedimenticolaceae bacterium]|nr:VWA domain-containing protein [Candidatus Polarisedimenticolaceae bacterium]
MTRIAMPWALAALPLAAVAVWVLLRRLRRGGPRIAFPDVEGIARLPISPWVRLERILPWLRGLVLGLLVFALARPQSGASVTSVSSKGVDILVGLDISGSMRCEDTPRRNRLGVAKACIAKFVEGRPNDRLGLVAFASVATTRCPLTLDHEMLQRFVDELDFAPIGESRTALGMGLATSINRMRSSQAKSKVVVLVTDGRNNTGQVGPEAAAAAAQALGVKVYTVGVGSDGEVQCLVDDPRGGRHYEVTTADLDEDLLQKIATSTGGRYFRATDASGMEMAFQEIDRLERTEIESRVRMLYTEKFGFLLLPAAGLLALELLLAGTRLRRIP